MRHPDVTPPHSIEAETGLLGCVLQDPSIMDMVGSRLSANEFYELRHGIVYSAMCSLYEKREPIGVIGLREQLGDELDVVGGVAFLSQCQDAIPSPIQWEYYTGLIQRKARLRAILTSAREMERLVGQGGDEEEILEAAEKKLLSLFQRGSDEGSICLKDALLDAVSLMEKAHESDGCVGVPTGFDALDRLTTGLHPGSMIVLAARPSMGKTTLAMNIALNAAIREKVPVGIFSIEMTASELGVRTLSEYARTDGRKMIAGELVGQEIARIMGQLTKVKDAPLHIEEVSTLTPVAMRAKARRLKAKHDIQLLVIDYLQLMKDRADSRVQEVSQISNAIKALAKELRVPVLALSQLNRNVEARGSGEGGGEPRLSDLRDSGSIEQDADMVWMLHRPSSESDLMKLLVLKNRNGPVAALDLVFTRRHYSFRQMGAANEVDQ